MSSDLAVVLLVEDDPLIARFVGLALEGLPLELITCASAEEAQLVLPQQPCAMLITDLMLPGISGLKLIEWLRSSTSANCQVVVFSAGVDYATTQQLDHLNVHQVLRKPVSVIDLVTCVQKVLELNSSRLEESTATLTPPNSTNTDVIDKFFCGDCELFFSYRASCSAQMPTDVAQGSKHLTARDSAAFRRLAHNLKSVFKLLGQEHAFSIARNLEQACLNEDWVMVDELWMRLVSEMQVVSSWR